MTDFSPHNPIVKICLQGQQMEAKGIEEEAGRLFLQAWNESTRPFERFMSAWFLARVQRQAADRLGWLEAALQAALEIHDGSVNSAFASLYSGMAQCHEDLCHPDEAQRNHALAASSDGAPADAGPFYHGTRADLQAGDLLLAGGLSNYQADLKMNHIYFTALVSGAGLAAALAKGDNRGRVYRIEPTGPFENDPNVTNKKFPGNLTRSYRSVAPLKVIGEVTDWLEQTPEETEKWRKRVAANQGQIIN
ncbi:MAG: NAD(+)--rifampin ADP-ribosyltransferase [Pseudomonadota bacterium]